MKNYKGITLIALVVTIVVLLILAGVSISMLGGENGIIKQAQEARKQTKIGEEKEIIAISALDAKGENLGGKLEIDILQDKLDINAGNGKTEIINGGDTTVIKFTENDRYYEIDSNGEIEGPKELEKDIYAGDLTKGGNCDGSESKPFEINCIEDLVTFSNQTNAGNKFTNQYVILKRTLDFKSIFSYNDHTATTFGDINTDGIIENIKTELTKTDEGCVGFLGIAQFDGTFDGKENEIKNIYQNVNNGESTALFKKANKEIKNVSLSGTIINNNWHAAGICVEGNVDIINCKNYADITGHNMVAGIRAYTPVNGSINTEIKNCINYGKIDIKSTTYGYGGAGGIVGNAHNMLIENCINEGEVLGTTGLGRKSGIVGCVSTEDASVDIYNCVNKGKCDSGIVGLVRVGTANIVNCYNIGECTNGIVNNLYSESWENILELNIKNCYNVGKVTNSGILGAQGTTCKSVTVNIENCYNAMGCDAAIIAHILTSADTTTVTKVTKTYYDNTKVQNVGAHSDGIIGLEIQNNESFVETLNSNIGENTEWRHWKIGDDGYPTFE